MKWEHAYRIPTNLPREAFNGWAGEKIHHRDTEDTEKKGRWQRGGIHYQNNLQPVYAHLRIYRIWMPDFLRRLMSFIGNLIWFILGGEIMCFCYIIYGILLCITSSVFLSAFNWLKSDFSLRSRFGKEVREKSNRVGIISLIFNILYIICGGFSFAILHLILGLLFVITIAGYPFGLQHFKLAKLSLTPFGKEIRTIEPNKSN